MISVIRWKQTCMDILCQVQTPVQTHKSDEHASLEVSCELPFTLDDPHDGLDHLQCGALTPDISRVQLQEKKEVCSLCVKCIVMPSRMHARPANRVSKLLSHNNGPLALCQPDR